MSIQRDVIGAIVIHPMHTVFDVRDKHATHVLEILQGLTARGRRLKAELVK